MNLTITVDLMAMRDLTSLLGPAKRVELHEAMGYGVREKTTEYLQALAGSRHPTAERLGAQPTGFLAEAARAVEKSPVAADGTSATMTINHIGMIRAFRDVTITPKTAKMLAIPLDAMAYGRRPREWAAGALFVWKSKVTGNAFLAQRQEDKHAAPLLMYLLVRSVTQKQDRTLLPSNEEFSQAGKEAADVWFQREIEQLSHS